MQFSPFGNERGHILWRPRRRNLRFEILQAAADGFELAFVEFRQAPQYVGLS
jgi:hypothetical protein